MKFVQGEGGGPSSLPESSRNPGPFAPNCLTAYSLPLGSPLLSVAMEAASALASHEPS